MLADWYADAALSLCDLQKREDAYQGAPAGVLYAAKNTIATVERGANEAAVEAAHCKKLRMNGLILDDPAVIRAMEKNAQGVFIPAKLKKDGSPDNYSSVASLAQLGILQRHVEDMVGEMAAQLADGRIPASPVKEDAFSICDNCDYRAVCKTGDENCAIGTPQK
ncbi:MAG: PD-(D/E)XK nuclease family protein [Oscillospiraceae bacterium]